MNHTVNRDGTGIHHAETKEQSRQWKHQKSKKNTIFKAYIGIMLINVIPLGCKSLQSIIQRMYYQVYCKLERKPERKRKNEVLLHDSAVALTAALTTDFLFMTRWEIIEHPLYSPDWAA